MRTIKYEIKDEHLEILNKYIECRREESNINDILTEAIDDYIEDTEEEAKKAKTEENKPRPVLRLVR
jgi:hypothetical protein